MTTVLGAVMGRALRVAVAHIEGGLRSFDLRHPFPEELNRRLASTLARIHYAPGAWAASNLRRGDVVDTGSNTIRDSLELVPDETRRWHCQTARSASSRSTGSSCSTTAGC